MNSPESAIVLFLPRSCTRPCTFMEHRTSILSCTPSPVYPVLPHPHGTVFSSSFRKTNQEKFLLPSKDEQNLYRSLLPSRSNAKENGAGIWYPRHCDAGGRMHHPGTTRYAYVITKHLCTEKCDRTGNRTNPASTRHDPGPRFNRDAKPDSDSPHNARNTHTYRGTIVTTRTRALCEQRRVHRLLLFL